MARIRATAGKRITLHAFTIGHDSKIVDQPANYPKLDLYRMNGDDTVELILSVDGMNEDVDGEYFYNWTPPLGAAQYKVKYTSQKDGEDYFGYDEIDINEELDTIYELLGTGVDRFDLTVQDTPLVLSAQFFKNKIALNPDSVVRVEIYDDIDEAKKDYGVGVPLETITSITPHGSITGRFGYQLANAITLAKLYYDKVYLIPEAGGDETAFILPFYVRKVSVGITPKEKETCKVRFDIVNMLGENYAEKESLVYINREWAWYGNAQVRRDKDFVLDLDGDGVAEVDLIETDTMTADTGEDVYYILKIGRYEKKFKIPKGTLEAEFIDLPEYTS